MIALILTATLWLHSTAELSDWYAEWLATPATSDVKMLELTDMEQRHPCFPVACVMAPTNSVQIGTPLVVGGGDAVERWRPLVAYFWPAEHVDRMLRILACETVPAGNPNSVNPDSGAAGLFQIMPQWQRTWPGDYFDPWTNVSVAYQIWLVQGYRAWVCKG